MAEAEERQKSNMKDKGKFTNPANHHSWLLQAKVVGPSYGGPEIFEESWNLQYPL